VAEIKVEKKKRSSIAPWIIGLILLALVIWGLSQLRDNNRDNDRNTSLAPAAPVTLEVLSWAPPLAVSLGVRAA
jgi:hypothetical protein